MAGEGAREAGRDKGEGEKERAGVRGQREKGEEERERGMPILLGGGS